MKNFDLLLDWKEVTLNSRNGKKKALILIKMEKKYSKDFFDFFGNKFNVFVDYRRIETPKSTKCLLNLYSLGLINSNGEKVCEGYYCTRDSCISMLIQKIGIDKIDEIKEFADSIISDLDFYFSKEINNL